MIGTVIIGWDDAGKGAGAEPATVADRVRRLLWLGLDVVMAATGDILELESRLQDLAPSSPEASGRLTIRPGPPARVLEELRQFEGGQHLPESIVVVGQGDLGTRSERRLLAELDDIAAAATAFAEPVADPSWRLEVTGFEAAKEREVESWFTVGNGRCGTRGSLDEAGPESSAAVYVAGVFGRPNHGEEIATHSAEPPPPVPELVKGAQWTFLLPRVDGRVVELDERAAAVHRRVLDLRQGILFREWRQALPGGGEWSFRSARFASLANRKLMVLEAQARATNGAVSIASDIHVPPQETVEKVKVEADGGRLSTGADRETVASVKAKGGGTARFAVLTSEHDGTLERFAAVDREDCGRVEAGADEAVASARTAGMARLRAGHRRAWRDRWEDADFVVVGDPHAQRALRFALYHLISAGDPDSDLASVGARGLTGPGYKGHVFWDTEVFVLPFLVWSHPPTARALLAYRYRTLPAAREKAERLGYTGALFAWESADTGAEATPPWIVLADGTRLEVHTDVQEHHISGDVAWAVWQYWQVTRDREFLLDMGAEILVETARFWESRVTSDTDGRYHIRKVIGPDEYHEGVDDNAFTNSLAGWNLDTAAEVVRLIEALDPSRRHEVTGRLGLEPFEPSRWRDIAVGLVDGFDPATLLCEQFAGFRGLEDLRAADLAPRPFTAELVLGVDRLPRTQVVKQADVVMLAHMLPELFPPGGVAANYRYYEPRTCHGSSLSPAIHAAVAARIGVLDEADRYFRMAADVDLDDRMGNAAQGVHIATMGGLWQAAFFGFAGVRADGEALRLDPHLPPAWQGCSFPALWRGTHVHAEIRPDVMALTLAGPATVAVGTGPPSRLDAGRYVVAREGDDWSAIRHG